MLGKRNYVIEFPDDKTAKRTRSLHNSIQNYGIAPSLPHRHSIQFLLKIAHISIIRHSTLGQMYRGRPYPNSIFSNEH